MIEYLKEAKKIFKLLSNSEFKKVIIILINGLVNLLFDLMSIGLIIPIIYNVINQNTFNFPYFGEIEINLYTSLFIFIIIIIIKNLFFFYNSRLLLKFCKSFYERISLGLLKNQLNTDYLKYLKIGYSDFSRSILLEVNYLVGFYRGIINFIINSFIFLGILIFLLFFNFTATISLIIFYFSFLLLPSLFIYRKIDKLAKDRKSLDKNKIYISNHIFQNISIIKLFNIENFFINFFKNANEGQQTNLFQISTIQLLPRVLVELTTLVFLVLMISLKIYYSVSLEEIIVVITIYLFAAIRMMPSINEIMSSLQQVKYYHNSFHSIFLKIVSLDNKINNEKLEKEIKLSFENKLEFKNLSFAYPGETKKVLENLSFEIKKNSLFGIHGESGSGKTTLINIILGLIKPTDGLLLCDKKDINKNNKAWQKLISYVPSSYLLLNSSIKSNIAYGINKNEVDDNNVLKALKGGQLTSFLENNNINTDFIVEEDGKNLSAGQIQRICISRAFYRGTPLLILDEPTSNLDKENAYKIISLIKELKDLTTIIVSHDKNIIQMCDNSIKLK